MLRNHLFVTVVNFANQTCNTTSKAVKHKYKPFCFYFFLSVSWPHYHHLPRPKKLKFDQKQKKILHPYKQCQKTKSSKNTCSIKSRVEGEEEGGRSWPYQWNAQIKKQRTQSKYEPMERGNFCLRSCRFSVLLFQLEDAEPSAVICCDSTQWETH